MDSNSMFNALDAKIMHVSIPLVEDIKTFVSTVANFACNASLLSGRYIIDAKSIMGVFSLDTTRPIKLVLEVGANGVDDRDALCDAIERYIIDD